MKKLLTTMATALLFVNSVFAGNYRVFYYVRVTQVLLLLPVGSSCCWCSVVHSSSISCLRSLPVAVTIATERRSFA
jgi:hypothetical protein